MTGFSPHNDSLEDRDVPETPKEERYGDGTTFDHEEARKNTIPVSELQNTTENSGNEEPPIVERVEWLDDTETTRKDLKVYQGGLNLTCRDCLEEDGIEFAAASYQLPIFEKESHLFQLLQKHGLRFLDDAEADVDYGNIVANHHVRAYVAPDGLLVKTHGEADRPERSYLDVEGPAGAAEAFVRDLHTATKRFKRILRPLSLESAAARNTEVPNEHRLVEMEVVDE